MATRAERLAGWRAQNTTVYSRPMADSWQSVGRSATSVMREIIGGPMQKGLTPTHMKSMLNLETSVAAIKRLGAPKWMQNNFAVGSMRAGILGGATLYTAGNVRNAYNRARQGDIVGAGVSAAQVAGVVGGAAWLFKGAKFLK